MFEALKHHKRIASVEEAVERLERAMRAMELEWSNTYDKLRMVVAKLAKREQPLPPVDPVAPPSPSNLTSRAHAINEQILARRNRLRSTEQ